MIKPNTLNPNSYVSGTKCILLESTAVHITSIHPSVVIILNKVIIDWPTLSKFES